VLAVKALAGNYLVNYLSLSNSSLERESGEFQFAPHCPYCGPPSRSALTWKHRVAGEVIENARVQITPLSELCPLQMTRAPANYLLNLFFHKHPTALLTRAIATAGELQSRRYVHVTSVSDRKAVPNTFLDRRRQLRGMRHLGLLAALLQDFLWSPAWNNRALPAPFSTHQIRAASASLLHASTKLYCSSASLGRLSVACFRCITRVLSHRITKSRGIPTPTDDAIRGGKPLIEAVMA